VKNYSKLFLATLGFLSATTVLAGGSLKGEALQPVTIPNFDGGAIVSVGALYMMPSSTNTDYLGYKDQYNVEDADPTTTKRNWNHYRVDPDYDWGFTVGVGYMMAGNSKDARVDWTHFNSDTTSNKTLSGALDTSVTGVALPLFGVTSLGVTLIDGEYVPDTLTASGKMKYRFDAVDFTLGQYVNVGSCLQLRKFMGVRYARLDSDLSTHYDNMKYAVPSEIEPDAKSLIEVIDATADSRFNGVGPLVGVSASYGLGYGFGVNAMFDMALLVGQLKLNATIDDGIYSFGADQNRILENQRDFTAAWDGRTVVAPAFDGSFSLDYGYDMGAGMSVALELGYKVSKYLNTVEQIDADTGASLGPAARFDTDVTNFGLNGAFLTLTLKA